jgi:predicted alpha/beta hydrolase
MTAKTARQTIHTEARKHLTVSSLVAAAISALSLVVSGSHAVVVAHSVGGHATTLFNLCKQLWDFLVASVEQFDQIWSVLVVVWSHESNRRSSSALLTADECDVMGNQQW